MGIGYVMPAGMSKKEFFKLYSDWNKKLEKSGHTELERFTPDGLISPFFNSVASSNSPAGSAASALRRFTPEKQDYYHFISVFAQNADFKKLYGPRIAKFYQWLMERSAEGLTLDTLLHLVRTKSEKDSRAYVGWFYFKTKWNRGTLYKLQQKLIQDCFTWHRTDPEGYWYDSGEDTEG